MLNCSIHQDGILSSVCFDLKCQNRGLICSQCAREDHMSHIIIPFQELQYFLSDESQNRQTQNHLQQQTKDMFVIEYYFAACKGNIKQVIGFLDKFISNFKQRVERLKDQLVGQVERCLNVFSKRIQSTQSIIHTIVSANEGCQGLLSNLLTSEDFFELDENSYIKSLNFQQYKDMHIQLDEFSSQFSKYLNGITEVYNSVESFFVENMPTACPVIDLEDSNQQFQSIIQAHNIHMIEAAQQATASQDSHIRLAAYSNALNSHQQQQQQQDIIDDATHNCQSNKYDVSLDDKRGQRSMVQVDQKRRLTNLLVEEKRSDSSQLNYNQVLTPSCKNSSGIGKFRFTPNSKQEIQTAWKEINDNNHMKSLWIDIPPQATSHDLYEISQILKIKRNIQKLFIAFSKHMYLDPHSLDQLFESISHLTTIHTLAFKMKRWESLTTTLSSLAYKNLSKCILNVSDQDKELIRKSLSSKNNSMALYQLIDFS